MWPCTKILFPSGGLRYIKKNGVQKRGSLIQNPAHYLHFLYF